MYVQKTLNVKNASTGAKIPAFWIDYGHKMVAMLEALPPQHGAFVMNCNAHCQTGTAAAWGGHEIKGISMSQAVSAHALCTTAISCCLRNVRP